MEKFFVVEDKDGSFVPRVYLNTKEDGLKYLRKYQMSNLSGKYYLAAIIAVPNVSYEINIKEY